MLLIILINAFVFFVLLGIALAKGLEAALPFATFAFVFVPTEARISLGFFELTTQRLTLVLLLLIYVAMGSKVRGSDPKVANPLKYLMFAHFAWCIVSTADSIVPVASFKKLLSVVFDYYVLYFIYWRCISKVQTIYKILTAMVVALTVCSIFGAYEAYHGWNVVSLLPAVTHRFGGGAGAIDEERGIRVETTFDHPILYGTALAMAISIVFFLLSTTKKGGAKILLWASLILMFLNIYKTSSRGPWLDAIMVLVLLLALGRNRLRRYVLVVVALSATVCVIRPGVWDSVKGIYLNTMDTNTAEGSSYEYRYALQQAATHALLKSPGRALWGYGLESFFELKLEGEFLGEPHKFLSADDSWVELMVETGFVGLFILIILLLKPMVLAWREFRKIPGPERYLGLLFFINFAIFYFQMLSVGMYSWGQNGYMLWILIAAAYSLDRLNKAEFQRQHEGETNEGSNYSEMALGVPRAAAIAR